MSMNTVNIVWRTPWPRLKPVAFRESDSHEQQPELPERKERVSREELIELFHDKLRP